MKKLIYLIVVVVALGLIVAGCIPTVPPSEQGELGTLPTKSTFDVNPGDSIQAAINAASPGDTIIVAVGTYYETISITTDDLTIQSLSGDPSDTIIDPTVNIAHCSGVTLSGFTIANSKHWGLFLNYATDCELSSIIISDVDNPGWDAIGLYLIASSDNSFINCEISNITTATGRSAYGIYLQYGCDRNTFTSTKVSNIEGKLGTMGILFQLGNSHNSFESTEISNITAIDGTAAASAIVFYDGSNNGNEFNTTTISNIEGGAPTGSTYGIYFAVGEGNSFSKLNISDFNGGGRVYGIRFLSGAKNNSFDSSSISGTKHGMYLEGDCSDNSIHNTNIFGNTEYGAYSEKVTLDATCNWWGDTSGPYHSTNPLGAGNAISSNVDFAPWLLDPAPDAMCCDYNGYGFDKIAQCAINATNHGKFVNCVAHLTNDWLEDGDITAEEKGAIMSWAAKSDIGKK